MDLFALPIHRGVVNLTSGRSVAAVDRLGRGTYGFLVANYGGPLRLYELNEDGVLKDRAGEAALDFPVSMGSVRFASAPDQPILVHLGKVVVPGNGRPAREQAAQGRAELTRWSFADLEAQIRSLLKGALGPFGLDPARDIEAITVNRWAHGYAYEYMRPWAQLVRWLGWAS